MAGTSSPTSPVPSSVRIRGRLIRYSYTYGLDQRGDSGSQSTRGPGRAPTLVRNESAPHKPRGNSSTYPENACEHLRGPQLRGHVFYSLPGTTDLQLGVQGTLFGSDAWSTDTCPAGTRPGGGRFHTLFFSLLSVLSYDWTLSHC